LTLFFAPLGGLLVLAFIANRLVRFTRVPDVIILMATGVLIGPVLHCVNPDIFRGASRGFGALAPILILFEGGLNLKLREILITPAAWFEVAVLRFRRFRQDLFGLRGLKKTIGISGPSGADSNRKSRFGVPSLGFY
jgi:predicted Kef-type K+ transport protein